MNGKLSPTAFLLWATMCGLLLPGSTVVAQSNPGQRLGDLPSHRYLPPPEGKNTLLDQIRSLERLSQDRPQSPQFELTPSQLKTLDTLLEAFRDEKGELNLPNPESIPNLLPDPKQRQQAQEMLEEYARSRQLQLSQSPADKVPSPFPSNRVEDNRGLAEGNRAEGNRAEGNRAEGNRAEGNRAEGNRAEGNRAEGNRAEANRAEGNRAEGNPVAGNREDRDMGAKGTSAIPKNFELPQDTPPELRKLYETLKQFSEQQQKAQREQGASSGAPARRPSSNGVGASGASPRNSSPSQRPGSRSRTRNESTPGRSNPSGASANRERSHEVSPPINKAMTNRPGKDGLANGTSGQGAQGNGRTESNGRAEPNGSANQAGEQQANPADGKDPLSPAAPPLPDPSKPQLTPFDEGYDFSADKKVVDNPFDVKGSGSMPEAVTPPSKPAEPFNVTRMSQQPRTDAPPAKPEKESVDWKKSVNDLGLGRVLKNIVQKTLKEQGLDPKNQAARAANANTNDPQSGPGATAAGSGASPKPNLPGWPDAQATEQLQKWAANAGNPTNNFNPSANDRWGRWLRDAWQTVVDAPGSSPRLSSSPTKSSAGSSAAAAAGNMLQPTWTNSMTVAVLVVAALIRLILWLSRRRVAELTDPSIAQAEWVRSVIAQGLKTRADVIRAFHQLVKQSRSVSDWWTHRSIVKHFSSQSPQLASSISELAIVYEQARYYPDDVELSPEQLAKVRTLLESVKIPTTSRT